MQYMEIKDALDYLGKMDLRAVFVPRQDGWRAHYALLDPEDSEVFATNSIESLVEQCNSLREKQMK